MKKSGTEIILSAGDLSGNMACRHLTQQDLQAAKGLLEAPHFTDPLLALMQERGLAFERKYLDHLNSKGLTISEPGAKEDGDAIGRTRNALRTGIDVIYQASMRLGEWQGRADFLQKVTKPSDLGNWSYEVIDSKLAEETRAGTMLQLCLYSEMLGSIQGKLPEYMYVITPEDGFTKNEYRVDDFMAYYRLAKTRVFADLINEPVTYPETVAHCDICRWWQACAARRRADDHLSLVAGLGNNHTREIRAWGINTLEKFGHLTSPLQYDPSRGAKETFERLKEQARVQLQSRQEKKPIHELIPLAEETGLTRLPQPDLGDIFFDFEGDPFAGKKGLEYLFGWIYTKEGTDIYKTLWAFNPEEERKTFEQFVDWVTERWKTFPSMHIYHFSPYEPATLKRLMGKYASKENEIDNMLRGGIFVDLHSITKQAVRAGVESYSLKELEIFHGFSRNLNLRDASLYLRAMEALLEREMEDDITEEMKDAVELYNKEDCLSTKGLRIWLEKLRAEWNAKGAGIGRPAAPDSEASENITQHQERIKPIFNRLAKDIPLVREGRDNNQQAKWLLANLLDWYRREKKAGWWEYFRLLELSPEELLEEKAAITGLHFTGRRESVKKSVVDHYAFLIQETEIKEGDDVKSDNGEGLGTVISIDVIAGQIAIKKGPKKAEVHPFSVFSHKMVNDDVKEEAIIRIASWVAANVIDADGKYRAGRDLLLRKQPRISKAIERNPVPQQAALQLINVLDNSVLPVQGPPGAGKSHTASQMILDLVGSGKKVGIVALSHKVIRNLLNKVVDQARKVGVTVQCVQKVKEFSEIPDPMIIEVTDNPPVLDLLKTGKARVVAGTAWLWAREEFEESVDVLFVDEAGQLSLIDTLAVSQAAKNLVLLGDPQQLKQPQQGVHPDGTEVSALEHILQEHKTIPEDSGIFLNETWRMHPDICSFVSELFYEKRLFSRTELSNQQLSGHHKYNGAGLWYEPVEHMGNQSSSPEEVDCLKNLIASLVNGKTIYTNQKGETKKLELSDIMIIAPYNNQVNALVAALPAGTHIGTVDKFQGQEAPVVIFSMATSTPADAPRGMEFLYSLNRLNVAVSRARAICILVASPALFEPDCNSPAQMRLANAFCRYREMSRP